MQHTVKTSVFKCNKINYNHAKNYTIKYFENTYNFYIAIHLMKAKFAYFKEFDLYNTCKNELKMSNAF